MTKKTTKINQIIGRKIYKFAKTKFTGIEGASTRKITAKINKIYPSLNVSYSTVNRYLNKHFKKPIRAKVTFKLTDDNRGARRSFCDYLLNEIKVSGRDIFFTDE